ncbi:MAG TPA: DsbA family protein [Tepidisphaeraceae bacterium]
MPDASSTPPPARLAVPLDPNRDHALGPWSAPAQLLEYGDYECPDCLRAHPVLDRVRERFGDRLLFAFRHFPLFTVHRHASVAAQAAEAAAAQGKFWAMHDLLYRNQDRLDPPDLTHYALKAGLEVYRFENALADGTYRQRVQSDFEGAQRSGVRGTPTLFLNGVRYEGPVEVDALAEAIERSGA